MVHVATVPQSLGFLRGQLRFMRSAGYRIEAVSSPGPLLDDFAREEGVEVHAVPMTRRVTPLLDLVTLTRLWTIFRRRRPHIVHAHTPKAGLLSMLAASATDVPVRIYHLRGLPWETARGPMRPVLRTAERLACGLAHEVFCVSSSLRKVAIEAGLCRADRLHVFGQGSGNGVDACERFNPLRMQDTPATIRRRLNLPADALVLGCVGRIVGDKGWSDLAAAWRELRQRLPQARLLVVGSLESRGRVQESIRQLLQHDPQVCWVGEVRETQPLYHAMDVLVLPTYREGLPNVALEAAAMEKPVIATRVTGCVDAVVHQVTGLLIPPRDPAALVQAVDRYAVDPALARQHGIAGRARVLRDYRPQVIWEAIENRYEELLRQSGHPMDWRQIGPDRKAA